MQVLFDTLLQTMAQPLANPRTLADFLENTYSIA